MLSGGPSTLPHPLVIDNLHVCQGHRGRCVRLRPRYRKRNIDASKSGASLSPSNSAHGRLGTQRPFRATAPHARWTNALRVDHPSPPEPFQPRRRPESIKARTSPITQLQDALQHHARHTCRNYTANGMRFVHQVSGSYACGSLRSERPLEASQRTPHPGEPVLHRLGHFRGCRTLRCCSAPRQSASAVPTVAENRQLNHLAIHAIPRTRCTRAGQSRATAHCVQPERSSGSRRRMKFTSNHLMLMVTMGEKQQAMKYLQRQICETIRPPKEIIDRFDVESLDLQPLVHSFQAPSSDA